MTAGPLLVRSLGEAAPARPARVLGFASCRGMKSGAAWGALSGFLYIAVWLVLDGDFDGSNRLTALLGFGSIAAVVGAGFGVVVGLPLGALIGLVAEAAGASARFPAYVAMTFGAVSAVPLVLVGRSFRNFSSSEELLGTVVVLALLPIIVSVAAHRQADAVQRRLAG